MENQSADVHLKPLLPEPQTSKDEVAFKPFLRLASHLEFT